MGKIPTEECLAAPTGLFALLEAVPTAGWLQIMLFTCMQETGAGNESSFFSLAKPQTVDAEAGDIAGIGWVRYDDPETKTFKLNAERQNGRAAMLGITGCLIHDSSASTRSTRPAACRALPRPPSSKCALSPDGEISRM